MIEEQPLTYDQLLEENRRLMAQNRANEERIAALSALQDLARSLSSELILDPLLKKTLRSAVRWWTPRPARCSCSTR